MDLIKLFQPITINGLTIPNRIVMPSMGMAFTDNYEFNDRFKAFYRERALGGVGLMTVGPVAIDRVGSAPFMPGLFDDANVEGFRAFLQEIHETTQTKAATQLFHMGRNAFSAFSGQQPLAPSPVPGRMSGETPREMDKEDIRTVQEAFARGAVRAREAGFDFVEIIACTGYLISQFLSPLTNHRQDEYGGPLENRMRFGVETVAAVRRAVGPDYPVGIRIAGNDFMEGGNTNVESARFAAAAQEAGVDAVNVTGGWHETNIPQLTSNVPAGAYVYLARGIKRAVSVPVFASNRLGDPLLAERTLRSGSADMICWGRPLIADPELPLKAREGRFDEVIPCIACNQGCFDSIFLGTAVRCVLNPRCGLEDRFPKGKAETSKKVFVAGGGPAGMEYALTASQRGHGVTLFEKQSRLGGQVNIASVPPGKEEFAKITSSMAGRMAKSGVEVRLGEALTKDLVLTHKPDLVVLATGALPMEMGVPGMELPHVVSAWDVLAEKVWDMGENVVVVGGSATGCETAHFIAEMETPDGKTCGFLAFHQAETPEKVRDMLTRCHRKITVVDLVGKMAANMGRTWRWSLMKSLRLMGIDLLTETRLLEITPEAVWVETRDGKQRIPADTVVMSVGVKPVDGLKRELEGVDVETVVLGDAKQPRNLTDAVREGFEAAFHLE